MGQSDCFYNILIGLTADISTDGIWRGAWGGNQTMDHCEVSAYEAFNLLGEPTILKPSSCQILFSDCITKHGI